MDLNLLPYQIGIDMIPKIGSINAKRLIAYCGGVEAVFKESKNALTKVPGIGSVIAHEIVNQNVLDRAKIEVDFIVKHNIQAFFYLDNDYPQRLKQCEDGPIVLFVSAKTSIDFNQQKVISVVGTRSITDYGKAICEDIISSLAKRGHNPIIVSGLAYGVDICAHRAALKNDLPTVAVLGHGLNTIYPSIHRNTAKEIYEKGALVTDFPSGTTFDRNNFIKRNRIIAGLSDATLVVESAEQGGSLITADIAVSYNREVFAIPGQVGSKYSRGCNLLIKTNKAALIDSADDIEFQLDWGEGSTEKNNPQLSLFTELSADEQAVFNVVRERGQEVIDVICFKTKFPVAKVSALLLNLEFAGLVKSRPGKVYSLTRSL
ncbi:MAG: DNA-processing protein DprA [Bacteroidales bacterium]|jgi:DNA processing protein|nr:DNA-processing protein DprA [Bacteroidales bacterium]MDD4384981.1 DNA-processing protein DprA [Bacteroidales bacterium]MDY0196476.1 DNA-processing protein DprA [Tenuifilaceae bacterium]